MHRVAMMVTLLVTPATLPEGFLLLEEAARGGPDAQYAGWTWTDKLTEPLRLSPCDRPSKAWDTGRLAARTVRIDDPPAMQLEQVVVYQSERFARMTMDGLRARLRKCRSFIDGWGSPNTWFTKPLRMGDEAFRAGVRIKLEVGVEGSQYVAVRRGSAVMIYGADALPTKSLPVGKFRPLIKLAEEMTEKVCELPQEPCPGWTAGSSPPRG